MTRVILLFFFTTVLAFLSSAQTVLVSGKITDAASNKGVYGVTIIVGNDNTVSKADGTFQFNVTPFGPNLKITFYKDGYNYFEREVAVSGQSKIDLGDVGMEAGQTSGAATVTDEDRIPTVTLSGDDDESELGGQNVSGVLSAASDPFVEAAAFNLSNGGFEIRGYDSEAQVFMNGIYVNNFETGAAYFGAWGGLNDVTRNRESTIDLTPIAFSFGGIGGATTIDTRASEQRKQRRVSYMFSNRASVGRVMATWSTGMNEKGWALSISGSKRWAEEGYLPGTFYNSYSYFLSVDKKLGDRHLLNFTGFGVPIERGGQSPSTKLANGLAGDDFYNPQWGWQNGKKRNARITKSHLPLVMLRHDWKLSEKATLTTAIGHWFGRYGRTQLDWFNAKDPRPDYYRNLPDNFRADGDLIGGDALESQLKNDPDLLQIQWDNLYWTNLNTSEVLENQARTAVSQYNPQAGDPGNFSPYVLAEQRSDLKRWNFHTYYQNIISNHLTVNWGLNYLRERNHYFTVLDDLLGGDYFLNIDPFALDVALPPGQSPSYNTSNPDVVVHEGDTYEYDFYLTGQRYGSWLQGLFTFRKIDFFLAGEVSRSDFWRTGNFTHGRFPETSLGDSEKQDFLNYSTKGGITYKINGRNYLYANGAYLKRAPDSRIAFASPRTRNQLVPQLQSENVRSGEAGYLHRAPTLKARATFYLTEFQNGIKLNRFYSDDDNEFVSYVMSDIDRRHAGIELAVDKKLTPSWSVSAVAAISENIYSNRPNGFILIDESAELRPQGQIYAKNFYVPNSPQTALSGTLEYRSPKFWSASVSVNYFDRNYIDFNPERRTAEAVFNMEPGSDAYNKTVNQERLDDVYTVDIFANKSFKINEDDFFYLTLGINNLLNATNITGGFEQLRYKRAEVEQTGINLFPPKYFYGFGTNFFLMGALRF